ncbi:lipid phosphate phosphatase 2 [Pyrenophora seminiperda CCB06]|uniref:Lipid phosphate phosphatase 2 n=1 Tax=Pyrenophora seminiperda CCB06 TaxID=1302712 RepID=A0A3M7M4C1_9PLEO|nr:lipid phosphate phosphatase 2 [Pyrenophora seminiperda CCB06]
MPPRIPIRLSWTSNSPSAPPSAWNTTLCVRSFSSTPASLALGPQSPNYIDVPKPLQPSYPVKPDVKGHLPIPRDIFKVRSKHPKESQVFIARSTREPKEVKAPGPYSKDAEYRLYKQRLAEKRREALREGVKELHERKVTSEAEYMAKIQAIGATRRALAMAPRREVDILTETSVAKGIRDFLTDALPPRPDISKARSRAYQRRVARINQVRASRLHDLYTNARKFIVDEQQLDEAIEKAFGTEEEPMGWNKKGVMGPRKDGHDGLSPWNGRLPEGVRELLFKLKGGEGVGLAKERVKKLAEELTGGKM